MIHRLSGLALAVLTSVAVAHADTFRESFSETRPLDPRGVIQIHGTNGSIAIRTWDRNEVSIQGEKRASNEEDLHAIQVEIEAEPARLSVEAKLPKHAVDWLWGRRHNESVELTVTIPQDAKLAGVDSVNGNITIIGARGPVTASIVNGSVHATGLEGAASLKTVNGSVYAELATLAPDTHLSFRSVNGSITVLLPKSAGATVDASTVNGGVKCDLPMRTESSRSSSLRGTIGDGQASLKASAVNGGIRIREL